MMVYRKMYKNQWYSKSKEEYLKDTYMCDLGMFMPHTVLDRNTLYRVGCSTHEDIINLGGGKNYKWEVTSKRYSLFMAAIHNQYNVSLPEATNPFIMDEILFNFFSSKAHLAPKGKFLLDGRTIYI